MSLHHNGLISLIYCSFQANNPHSQAIIKDTSKILNDFKRGSLHNVHYLYQKAMRGLELVKTHRGHMIGDTMLTGWDVMRAEAMQVHGGARVGQAPPRVPHSPTKPSGISPTKYSLKQKALDILLPLWPIAAFLFFLYLVWRCGL